ncbi:hypothetical protein [Marimonas arenosa]|uniref:Uncharacterized protein n=1 Tax=Marimonas arenosa TaxID=1795305 RepID=A0AAE3WA80_9RHOB|nr:hypothetical protein [Marimonas arenosa]MDQ2088800.1 hypothetical protein [Marimonas arenosa]
MSLAARAGLGEPGHITGYATENAKGDQPAKRWELSGNEWFFRTLPGARHQLIWSSTISAGWSIS